MWVTWILYSSCFQMRFVVKTECANSGGKGECCTNFHLINGTCAACPPGTYGDNCSTACPNQHYGENCGLKCNCGPDEECHTLHGCRSIATTPISQTTTKSFLDEEKTSLSTTEVSNTSLQSSSQANIEKITKGNTKSTPKVSILSTTTGTGPTLGGGDSSTTRVIIITGSVLSLFLIIIIVNQIHEKLKKRRTEKVYSNRNQGSSNMIEEETYVDINESSMLGYTSRYDKIKSQSSVVQRGKGDTGTLTIEANVLPPILPSRMDNDTNSDSSQVITEHHTEYLDVVHQGPTGNPDNAYVDPVTSKKNNAYTEVVGTPPDDQVHGEHADNNSRGAYQEIDEEVFDEGHSIHRDGYLQVVH